MRMKYGDMLSRLSFDELVVITTNSVIKSNGALVMGAGIAGEVSKRFPGIDSLIGKMITKQLKLDDRIIAPEHIKYGFMICPAGKLAIFQTKYHFKYNSPIELITYSKDKLKDYALSYPDKIINLNFPGIANGGLKEEVVLPIIKDLPDNVFVWKFVR